MKENTPLPPAPLSESTDSALLPIENLIHIIRGQQVMLDSDLARLYGVETRVLNHAVKRNIYRFPEDFIFQLLQGSGEKTFRLSQNGFSGSKGANQRYQSQERPQSA